MAKSVIAVSVIFVLILIGSIGGYFYTDNMVKSYSVRLDKALENPDVNLLKEVEQNWDKDKNSLMYLMNHRDIESVSTSLIRAREEAAAERYDMAVQEIAVAKFLLDELIEREKLSPENIF
ncbi:MAG: DUF4363 family protein [Clostridia bacterium]|nr:DUF4363 family protein [Clostridia bacterium]